MSNSLINLEGLKPLAQHRGQTLDQYAALLRQYFTGYSEALAAKCIGDIVRWQLCPLAGEIIFTLNRQKTQAKAAVTIDGWYAISQRFDMSISTEFGTDGDDIWCKAVVTQPGTEGEIRHDCTEFLSECKAQAPNKENWNKMPKRMLRHRTVGQVIRMACGRLAAPSAEELREAGLEEIGGSAPPIVHEASEIFRAKARKSNAGDSHSLPGPDVEVKSQ